MDLAEVVAKLDRMSRRDDYDSDYYRGSNQACEYILSLLRPILKDQTSFDGQSTLGMAKEVLRRTKEQIDLSTGHISLSLNYGLAGINSVVEELSEVIDKHFSGEEVKELRPIEESYIPSLGDDVIYRCLNGSYAAKVTKVGRNKMADLCVFWNLKGPQQELNVPLGSGLDKYLPKLQRAS